MNEIEQLKENYDHMSYLERLEYLSNQTGYISLQLKNVKNECFAHDYIKEYIDRLVNIISIYKNDIELSKYIHQYILEIIEAAPKVLGHNLKLSSLIPIVDDLYVQTIKELPKNIKLGKLLNKIADKNEEIACIIGVTPSEFNRIIEKMGEHTDEIASVIDPSKTFR